MANDLSTNRWMCSELVTISHPDRRGACRERTANLEEIGERRAALLAEEPARRGAGIRITCHEHELRGIVRSSTPAGMLGYWIEVLLNPQSRWSEALFRPKHLLKLPAGPRSSKANPLAAASGY